MSIPSRELWRRAEALLDELFDLPVAERERRLQQIGGDDPQLRDVVAGLLQADERSREFLETPIERAAPDLFAGEESGGDAVSAPATGGMVGPYRLSRELGRGGMGRVYLAERADGQYEQRVALKLIKNEIVDPELRKRFLRERQILADLEHPNIARLVDGGVTESGLPYFALELVEGEPLPAWCDRRRLAIDDRLRLFLQVCEAVDYAHHNLVVHRDLKPSNVLVTEEGRAKLLDFGIAKLLEAEPAGGRTLTGSLAMTPEFAAPEQLTGGAITTATDVYALGVLLYELLAGRHPHRGEDTSPFEVQRATLETEARRPSVAVRSLPRQASEDGSPGIEEIARARSTSPRALCRQLQGDLDNIVLKALRKEPAARYPSAEALRDEIVRHLHGLPVLAAQGSLAYRAAKFARRHRVSLLAAALVALSLVGALVASVSQGRRARTAEGRAVAIKDFLVDEMLAGAAPEVARGRELTVAEVVDAAARRIGRSFAGQPEIEAGVRETIGSTYLSLGSYEKAGEHLERARHLYAEHMGELAPETLEAQRRLAELHAKRGEIETAKELVLPALEGQIAVLGADHLAVARTKGVLAEIQQADGDWAAAHRTLTETLAGLERVHPDATEARLDILVRLVEVLKEQRRSAEAIAVGQRTLELQRQTLGGDHPALATTMSNLALSLRTAERYEDAEAMAQEALELRRRVLGPAHLDTVKTLLDLALVYWSQGRIAECEAVQRQALELGSDALGEDHPETVRAALNLAVALKVQGKLGEAESLLRRSVELYRDLLGEDHPSTVRAVRNLIGLLDAAGDAEEAGRLTEELIEIGRRMATRADADPTALNDLAYYLLARVPKELRQPVLALEMAERAVERTDRRWGSALHTLAVAYRANGDPDRAIEALEEAAARPDGVYVYAIERDMVELLRAAGDLAGAERFLEEHLERRRALRSPDDPLIGTSHRMLGLNSLEWGRYRDAEASFREAIAQFGKRYGPDHWEVLRAQSDLGEALMRQERYAEAEELLLAAASGLEAQSRPRPQAHRRAVELLEELDRLRRRPG